VVADRQGDVLWPVHGPVATLLGVDFTSVPTARKPITVAQGRLAGGELQLEDLRACTDWPAFEALLREPGPWLGAFDFPFGLPRAFADSLALGRDVAAVSAAVHARCATRMQFRALVDSWGQGLPHRRTDLALPAGRRSTSPLQTRYVPVGFMWFEGLQRLLDAGVTLPGLHAGDPARRALEAYPGALAHRLIGARSYKNHDGPDRRAARRDLVAGLAAGVGDGYLAGCPPLRVSPAARHRLLDDAGGDWLDAVLCLAQAGWAACQAGPCLPSRRDPVEGWIVGTA